MSIVNHTNTHKKKMNIQRLFNVTDNPVLELFMSQRNIDVIHEAIIDRIKKTTGVTISKQSERDILGIMTNVYNEHGNTKCPASVPDEVRKLNGVALAECVAHVKSGILMHLQYLHDASTLPVPIDRSTPTTTDKSMLFTNNFI